MTNVIAIFNHKGGVGKTTTAVNLSACLSASHGKRCLVGDLDPQANATRALLGKELADGSPGIRQVLLRSQTVKPALLQTSVDGLDILPADLSLSEAEFKLASMMSREQVLREALRPVVSTYDFIFLDCPPSLGLLTLNGLAAATHVLIPCETQFLSLRGLKYVTEVLDLVCGRLNPSLDVLGVLPTKFYVLSRANNEALQCMRRLEGVHVFASTIPRDVRAEEAPSHGKPLILYAPDSRSARAYQGLAKEVMERCRA